MPANRSADSPKNGREIPNICPVGLEPQVELPPVTSTIGLSPSNGTRGLGAGGSFATDEMAGTKGTSTGNICGGTTDVSVVGTSAV